MNTAIEKKTVDIILPSGLNEASERALSICELFIGRILASGIEHISVSVDTSAVFVESNNAGVKDAITLILRSKKIEPFYRQFLDLLHSNEISDELGEVRCVLGGSRLALGVTEKKGFPDFSWNITTR
ncbi:hypothetical protein [Sedimenticola hydrogenitrophicus]|uniref:hypothetical protein n=1 Tax=Sedimenticola hydrogenitrophicus TaxID=2967975 RepID=UPI0021A7DFE2|nr:hypothetical protein [Sedimenticola hydrogenitrophicus]